MKKTKKLHVQAFRFVIAGSVSSILDFSIYTALVFFGVYYLFSNVISISISTTVNYLINKNYVFYKSKLKSNTLEFFIFALLTLGYYFFSEILLYFLVRVGIGKVLAKPITSFVLMFYSFITRKLILFH